MVVVVVAVAGVVVATAVVVGAFAVIVVAVVEFGGVADAVVAVADENTHQRHQVVGLAMVLLHPLQRSLYGYSHWRYRCSRRLRRRLGSHSRQRTKNSGTSHLINPADGAKTGVSFPFLSTRRRRRRRLSSFLHPEVRVLP